MKLLEHPKVKIDIDTQKLIDLTHIKVKVGEKPYRPSYEDRLHVSPGMVRGTYTPIYKYVAIKDVLEALMEKTNTELKFTAEVVGDTTPESLTLVGKPGRPKNART